MTSGSNETCFPVWSGDTNHNFQNCLRSFCLLEVISERRFVIWTICMLKTSLSPSQSRFPSGQKFKMALAALFGSVAFLKASRPTRLHTSIVASWNLQGLLLVFLAVTHWNHFTFHSAPGFLCGFSARWGIDQDLLSQALNPGHSKRRHREHYLLALLCRDARVSDILPFHCPVCFLKQYK